MNRDHGLTHIPTSELRARRDRLASVKAWGPELNDLNFELTRRQPVELAQDAYYYGTAADLSR